MVKYYKSHGKYLGQSNEGLYLIKLENEVVDLPGFLYYFWAEFTEGGEVNFMRDDIIKSYMIDDEIFNAMIEALQALELLQIDDHV